MVQREARAAHAQPTARACALVSSVLGQGHERRLGRARARVDLALALWDPRSWGRLVPADAGTVGSPNAATDEPVSFGYACAL